MTQSDDELLGKIRKAVRSKSVGLRFKTDAGVLLYEAVISGSAGPAGSTILLLMLSPVLFVAACGIMLIALLLGAYYLPVLQSLIEALLSDGQIVGVLAIVVLVPLYRIWRRWIALSYVTIWGGLWRAGTITLSTSDGSLSCESPHGDWRAFARSLSA